MYKPVVLFRSDFYSEPELEICQNYFDVYKSRIVLPRNSKVIGRYSVLPFYYELAHDLSFLNSGLINSFSEHRFIANFDWYYHLKDITPRTWFDVTEASKAFNTLPNGMVLKGRTNSAKCWEWMRAETKDDFYRIDKFLHQHEMIANQGIVYRKYEPLEIIEESCIPNSYNFVNEWRCFFYKDVLLTYGYYWSMASDEAIARAEKQDLTSMLYIAQQAANRLAEHVNFFVVDVAKTVKGDWIVIEINDGQMSGLSMCDPEALYKNLQNVLDEK